MYENRDWNNVCAKVNISLYTHAAARASSTTQPWGAGAKLLPNLFRLHDRRSRSLILTHFFFLRTSIIAHLNARILIISVGTSFESARLCNRMQRTDCTTVCGVVFSALSGADKMYVYALVNDNHFFFIFDYRTYARGV